MIDIIEIRISVFGAFKNVDMSPEVIGKLLPKFLKKNMMPSSFKELDPQTQQFIARPQFVSNNDMMKVLISSERIDVIANQVNHQQKLDFLVIKSEMLEHIKTILSLNKIKGCRLSFGCTGLIEMSDVDIYKKLILPIDFYKENCPNEWNIRLVTRKAQVELSKEEEVNTGLNIQFSKVSRITNGIMKNMDAIILQSDINTLAEDNESRFEFVDIEKFEDWSYDVNKRLFKEVEEVMV